MSQLVRVLNNLNHLQRTDADSWLPQGEIKADAAGEFRTENGRVSMYRLGNGGPDLLRILAACALGRDNLERIDYIVIERALLADLGAEFDASAEGKTPDATVNKVHEDVVVITAVKLIDLVHGTWESEKLDRCEKKDLVDGGVSGFQNGFWTPDRVKSPKMKDSLRRILPDLKL